jgi:hypothetical protein
MTTAIKVHVNGQYRATVKQDDREPVVVEGNYNGGSGEKAFWLSHPANLPVRRHAHCRQAAGAVALQPDRPDRIRLGNRG